MNQESLHLSQQKLFCIKKKLSVDLKRNEIKICVQSFFMNKALIFRLDEIDENTYQVTKKSSGWFLVSAILVLSSIFCLIVNFLEPPSIPQFWPVGLLLLVLAGVTLSQYFRSTYEVSLYKSTAGKMLFGIRVNKPDKLTYDQFVTRLNELITLAHRKKELRMIIQNIPPEYLEKEFPLFYIQALLNRGVDVYELIDAVKKSFISIYVPESLVGNRVN